MAQAVIAFLGFELTDETFALDSLRTASDGLLDQTETLSINFISHISWIVGSWLGAVAGGLITDVRPSGLDYTLVAMFIALLVMELYNYTHICLTKISIQGLNPITLNRRHAAHAHLSEDELDKGYWEIFAEKEKKGQKLV